MIKVLVDVWVLRNTLQGTLVADDDDDDDDDDGYEELILRNDWPTTGV